MSWPLRSPRPVLRPTRRAAIGGAAALLLAATAPRVRAQEAAPVDLDALPGPPAPKVIAIDPGHGGREIGAAYPARRGRAAVLEKEVNLQIALLLAEELAVGGYVPVLTRTDDSEVNLPPLDRNEDGRIDVDDDLQARVDIANESGALLLISIHNNGAASSAVRGTSTWYCADQPWGSQSRVLAELVQQELLAGLQSVDYEPVDLGANDDRPLRKPYGHLFLTGAKTPRVARPTQLPSIVGESLFVTSDVESRLLQDEQVLRTIAASYYRAIDRYAAASPD